MPKASPELRRLRHVGDLSAEAVAEAVKIAEGTVRNVENGTTTASWRLMHRFARLYGVEVETLVHEDSAPEQVSA